jgi:hypothetical protein
VTDVHVWTNRPSWPQGIGAPTKIEEIPNTLKWSLWLGTASERPYNHAYLPFAWRGWLDFGTGALGDMGCHTCNLPFMALKLKYPQTVEAQSGPINGETFPVWAVVRHTFAEREGMPPVTFTWYEGRKDGKLVQPPEELLSRYKLPEKGYRVFFQNGEVFAGEPDHKDRRKRPHHAGSGCFMVGDKGILFSPSDYGGESYLVRDGLIEKVGGTPEKLPRSPGHHREWLEACKGGKPAMANFDYAGILTEFVLLGNVAMRVGKKLEWDGEKLCATNCKEADQLLKRKYSKGWTL